MFPSKICAQKYLRFTRCLCTPTDKLPNVITNKIGNITTIGLNRPQKRNCVDPETAILLKEAIEDFERDDSSVVGILYGTGGNFCAGYDLSSLAKTSQTSALPFAVEGPNGPMGPTKRFIKKPLIAAVSGYAVAGGLELALMCDLRVVEESAIFGVYCRRFGVPLIDGGTVRLQALIGLSRALDMILTGRAVGAKEAFDWGLANRLVATGTALGQAVNLATSIAKFPQECLLADRLSSYNSAFSSKTLEESLQLETNNAIHVLKKESVDGAKKFISGLGKHGKFSDITSPNIPDWEADENKKSKSKL